MKEAAAFVVLVVLAFVLVVVSVKYDEDACAARGGKLHCTTSSGVSSGGHVVTLTNCDCYTPDGRLLP